MTLLRDGLAHGRQLEGLPDAHDLKSRTLLQGAERLAYHQKHSAPVMESLRAWIEERRVEPNSRLGKALTYMVKHWAGLTRYLEDGPSARGRDRA